MKYNVTKNEWNIIGMTFGIYAGLLSALFGNAILCYWDYGIDGLNKEHLFDRGLYIWLVLQLLIAPLVGKLWGKYVFKHLNKNVENRE